MIITSYDDMTELAWISHLFCGQKKFLKLNNIKKKGIFPFHSYPYDIYLTLKNCF